MNTHDAILDAALRIYSETGSRGATTRRIAEAAGVNEVTLFRRFGTKQELLRKALERAAERVGEASLPAEPGDAERELAAWCRAQMRGLYEARALLRTSLGEHERNPEAGALACEGPARTSAEVARWVGRLVAGGRVPASADVEAATAMLLGALFYDAVTRDFMPGRYPYGVEEAAERYAGLFLRAIELDRPAGPAAGT
jgi:AcrR family transcriptional regulator